MPNIEDFAAYLWYLGDYVPYDIYVVGAYVNEEWKRTYLHLEPEFRDGNVVEEILYEDFEKWLVS